MPLCTITSFHRKCVEKDRSVSGPMRYSSSSPAGCCTTGPINYFPFVWHLIQAKSVSPPTVCLELPPFGAKMYLHKWIHQEGWISWNWVKALQHLQLQVSQKYLFKITSVECYISIYISIYRFLALSIDRSVNLPICLHYHQHYRPITSLFSWTPYRIVFSMCTSGRISESKNLIM